ncbi:MAG: hypothetical protein NTV06_00565 [candidate division Zixibacteria bacterium]|nr:hypothetical protein [candidate division Zixibacteria bacterium]
MIRHLKRRLRGLAGFFALGLITDILVILYLRSVQLGLVPLAMGVTFLITLVPFLVTRKGIEAKRPELFFAYALGASVGTALGMLIRLA